LLRTKNRKQTTLCSPASTCPQCNHKIRWFENIPVISWLFLHRKCSSCKTAISMQYPFVELLTAMLPVLTLWLGGITPASFAFIGLTYALITLSVIDFKHQLLPDSITQRLLWVGLITALMGWGFVNIEDAIFGALAGYLSLWSLYWLFKIVTKKEGMGFGDFKLFAVIGAWGGYTILPIVGVVAGIIGLMAAIILKLSGAFPEDKKIAFGPYLAIARWVIVFIEGVMTQAVF